MTCRRRSSISPAKSAARYDSGGFSGGGHHSSSDSGHHGGHHDGDRYDGDRYDGDRYDGDPLSSSDTRSYGARRPVFRIGPFISFVVIAIILWVVFAH